MRRLPFLLAVLLAGCQRPTVRPVTDEEQSPALLVRVKASYPGADARTVDDAVAAPLFKQINGAEGAERIESLSQGDGACTVTIRFKPGTDPDKAHADVGRRASLALPAMPEVCKQVGVVTAKLPAAPSLFWIALARPDAALKKKIEKLEGVAEVRQFGAGEPSLRINLDPERLAAYNLTCGDVLTALREQNVQDPAGTIRPVAKPLDLEKVWGIIVKRGAEGKHVRLRDVARIEMTAGDGFARAGDKPATLLAVTAWPSRLDAAKLRELAKVVDLSADRVAVIDLRLPDAALTHRTEEVVRQATDIIRTLPGKPDGLSHGEGNAATLLVKLPAEGGPDLTALRDALRAIGEASCRVRLATSEPTRLVLNGPEEKELRAWADAVAGRLDDATVGPGISRPSLEAVIDRKKVTTMRLKLTEVMETITTMRGATRFDLFGHFGRLRFDREMGAEDAKRLKVRNASGDYVPLGAVAELRMVESPSAILRVDGFHALEIISESDGAKIAEEERKRLKLPGSYKAER